MTDLLLMALSQYGEKEITGKKDNPDIMKYFHDIGETEIKHDETAWCSAFVNWCAMKSGYEFTKELTAKSWLNIGEKANDPEPGNIIVLWRSDPKSWKGHVGIFINEDENYYYILGGNQRNQVCISAYSKNRLLGFIKLNKI